MSKKRTCSFHSPRGYALRPGWRGSKSPGSLIFLERQRGDFSVKRIERWFAEDFDKGRDGRLRDAVTGPDGALYFLTSNRDGRGAPHPGDDKIYRIFLED